MPSSNRCNVIDKDLKFESISSVSGRDINLSYCKFVPIEEGVCLLGLKHPSIIYFKGILSIHCLIGKVEVLGYIISPGESKEVFSLMGSSATYLASVSDCSTHDPQSSYCHYLKGSIYKRDFEEICNNVGDNGVVALLTSGMKRYEHWRKLFDEKQLHLFPNLHSFPSVSTFRGAEETLECVFDHRKGSRIDRKIVVDESWDEYIRLREDDRLMICGGKQYGKSTLFRYLVNRNLQSASEVITIDLDVGQSEMNLSRTISCHVVKKPLLGPSFTNLRQPKWSIYVGTVNPAECVINYISAVQALISLCHEDSSLLGRPWIINTMGFTRGIGVILTCAAIRIIRPSRILVFNSEDKHLRSRNFTEPLLGNTRANSILNSASIPIVEFQCQLIHARAPADIVSKIPKSHVNIAPKYLRLAADTVYFADCFHEITLSMKKTNNELPDYSSGDIIPIFTEAASNEFNNCLGFVKVVSFDQSNGSVNVTTSKDLLDLMKKIKIKVSDHVIKFQETPRKGKRKIELVQEINEDALLWRRTIPLSTTKDLVAFALLTVKL